MKPNKALKKIKQLCTRFKTLLKSPLDIKSATKSENVQKIGLYSVAYKFIGGKTERFLPIFKDLDLNLQKSGLKVSFKAYVSLTVFTALLFSLTAMVMIPSILFLIVATTITG